MSFIATAIAGSAVLGYLGSNKAADSQSDAAAAALGLNREQYAQTRADLEPWRTGGTAANAELLYYLGLGTPGGLGPAPVMPTREQFTSTGAAPGSLALRQSLSLPNVSGGMSGRGGAQPGFGRTAAQGPVFDQAGFDAAMAKYTTDKAAYDAALIGAKADPRFGSLLDPFTAADLTSEPGYQFGLAEGEEGLNRAASAAGRYDSGATLKALTQFNQDYAGTKFNDAFARDRAAKGDIYGYLSGVSGTGANAATQTAGIGANAANAAGQYLTNAGDARAAGTVGGINAITGGLNSYLNYQQDQEILKYLRQPISGSPSSAGTPFGYRYG